MVLPQGPPEAMAYCRYCPEEFVVAGDQDVTAFDVIERVEEVEAIHRTARRRRTRHEWWVHYRPIWQWPLIDALLLAWLTSSPLQWPELLRWVLIAVTTGMTVLLVVVTAAGLRKARAYRRGVVADRARWTRR